MSSWTPPWAASSSRGWDRRWDGERKRPQVFPGTQSACIAQLGFTPEHMWQFKSSSGSESDLVGSLSLSPVSTPTQGVTPPAGTQPGVEFAGGTTQRMELSTSTDLDASTSSVMVMGFTYLYPDGDAGDVSGKAGGTEYYYFDIATGSLSRALSKEGANVAIAKDTINANNGIAFPWIANLDHAAGKIYNATPPGVIASTLLSGDLITTNAFRVGAVKGTAAHAITQFVAWTSGTNAEGLDHASIIAKAQATMGIQT